MYRSTPSARCCCCRPSPNSVFTSPCAWFRSTPGDSASTASDTTEPIPLVGSAPPIPADWSAVVAAVRIRAVIAAAVVRATPSIASSGSMSSSADSSSPGAGVGFFSLRPGPLASAKGSRSASGRASSIWIGEQQPSRSVVGSRAGSISPSRICLTSPGSASIRSSSFSALRAPAR